MICKTDHITSIQQIVILYEACDIAGTDLCPLIAFVDHPCSHAVIQITDYFAILICRRTDIDTGINGIVIDHCYFIPRIFLFIWYRNLVPNLAILSSHYRTASQNGKSHC